MYIDISGPLTPTLCGDKYFVTFIDDFSLYGYLYLIKEKYDAFENFKNCKTKVKKQVRNAIKIIRSNKNGECYGKHGITRQQMGLFSKYLQECGIVAQYTILGNPEQTGVVERRNCILKK